MHYHLCIFVFFLNHCWCPTATASLSLQFHQHVVISPFYYIFPRFFLSCVCVSVCFSVHVCICAHECACVRCRCRSQKDFDVFPATFCQKSAVWLGSAQGLPALGCEHTHLHLPSTPSIQAVSTRTYPCLYMSAGAVN